MNKSLLSCVLASCVAAGCGSKPAPVVPAPVVPAPPMASNVPPVVPADVPVTISGNGWSFIVPNSMWKQLSVDHDNTIVQALLRNNVLHASILFVSSPIDGSLDQLTLATIQQVTTSGGVVHSWQKRLVNGVDFTEVSTTKDDINGWFWLANQSTMSYGFICGGPVDNISLEQVCRDIANTIVFKP